MNYFKLKAAIKKYGEQFTADPEAAKEAIGLDYDKEEAEAIINALENPESEPKKEESNYQWFDEFEARIQKKEVRNPYTQRNETIITGWALEKKKHPKKIEPKLAIALNAFADGYDTLGVGNFLVPKDQHKSGDLIPYQSWAKQQGKDEKQDINLLLN